MRNFKGRRRNAVPKLRSVALSLEYVKVQFMRYSSALIDSTHAGDNLGCGTLRVELELRYGLSTTVYDFKVQFEKKHVCFRNM